MQLSDLARILKHWDDLTHEEKLFLGWGLRTHAGAVSVSVIKDRKLYTENVKLFLKAVEEAGLDLKDLRPAFY